MKTIIYIGGFELPDKNAAAHRVVNNAKALMKLGYRIVFIDIDRECHSAIDKTYSECFGCDRYSMQYTNKRLYSIDDFLFVVKRYKDVAAVIAYNYPAVALNKMHSYCHKHHIKIYADCTEWYGFQGENIIHKCIKGFDSFLRMNIIQPKLDGMIAISRYLENYYKEKLPTICIPPLVDKSDVQWNIKCVNKNTDTINIVYAGSPGRNKDKINKIVRTLSHLSNYDFIYIVIGITRKEFLKNYPEENEALKKIAKKIIFKGRIPHDEVLRYIKSADFSMFYRDINRVTMAGFPTKFSEAISCGTPVITTKTSDIGAFLIEGKNGYWLSDDIDNCMKRILSIDFVKLKNMKALVDNNIFDYNNYIDLFRKLF